MNTKLWRKLRLMVSIGPLLLCVPTTVEAQILPLVHQQGAPNFLYFQAENHQAIDPSANLNAMQWDVNADPAAQGGQALQITGTTVGPLDKQGALNRAKVHYNLQFSQPATYNLYLRVRMAAPGPVATVGVAAFDNLVTSAALINLPNTPMATNYRWYRVGGSMVVSDVNRLYTLSLRPLDNRISIDAILLSPAGALTQAQATTLTGMGASALAPATALGNVLQYTSFSGAFGEFPVDNTSRRESIVNVSTATGQNFALRGDSYLRLNTAVVQTNSPRLVFQEVGIDCGYTSLNFCFNYFCPDPTNATFEASDFLIGSVRYRNGTGGVFDSNFAMMDGTVLNAVGESYQRFCATLLVPAGFKTAQITLNLIADADDEDLFLGEAYLQANSLPTPAPVVDFVISSASGSAVTFDASASTNAGSFSYSFGDGTPSTEWVTDPNPVYIYPAPLVYLACASALDACGNRPDTVCILVDLLSALPVDWLSFSARAEFQQVRLDWATARERNNDYFEVERSADGRAFTSIGRIQGVGDSDQSQHYSFADRAPLSGNNYYRIRQVDVDGAYTYSDLRQLQWAVSAAVSVEVFPNPAHESVRINGLSGPGKYQLSNAQGQVLLSGQASLPLIEGLSILPAGLYQLVWTASEGGARYTCPIVLALP